VQTFILVAIMELLVSFRFYTYTVCIGLCPATVNAKVDKEAVMALPNRSNLVLSLSKHRCFLV